MYLKGLQGGSNEKEVRKGSSLLGACVLWGDEHESHDDVSNWYICSLVYSFG